MADESDIDFMSDYSRKMDNSNDDKNHSDKGWCSVENVNISMLH